MYSDHSTPRGVASDPSASAASPVATAPSASHTSSATSDSRLSVSCTTMPAWPKAVKIGGGSLEHPRHWLGAQRPGPFPGSAEPVRAARCSLRRRGSGTAKGTLCHGGMPKALSAAVWNRMPTMTFLPATASDVLPVEASIARLLAPYCRTTRLSRCASGPLRRNKTWNDSSGRNERTIFMHSHTTAPPAANCKLVNSGCLPPNHLVLVVGRHAIRRAAEEAKRDAGGEQPNMPRRPR